MREITKLLGKSSMFEGDAFSTWNKTSDSWEMCAEINIKYSSARRLILVYSQQPLYLWDFEFIQLLFEIPLGLGIYLIN